MRPKFCLQKTETASREQLAIVNCHKSLDATYRFGKKCEPDEIPIGDVPFCEAVFGTQPAIKNMYPAFLLPWQHREIWQVAGSAIYNKPVFAKSATHWKSDRQAKVYGAGETIPGKHLWVSDVVEFVDEWRYYVATGEVLTAEWYSGPNEDSTAPELDIDWPDDFSGAVDFGRLSTGEIALVEAHAPFACGWYGPNGEGWQYCVWQRRAWQYRDFWMERT